MKIELQGKQYDVRFYHSQVVRCESEVDRKQSNFDRSQVNLPPIAGRWREFSEEWDAKPEAAQTTCAISSVDGDRQYTLVAIGHATCVPADYPRKFNRSLGRKHALANTIKSIPRECRKQIWSAYFTNFKKV